MNTISIDDKEYEIDKMSDEEKSLVQAINFCDAKTQEVQNQLAALKTARQAYVNDLGSRLQK
jgi:hypothetical protein|tara:strand:+ start:44 stop:229 length:186 start_codon:yes stop_codon:yes gene_type:complete